MRRLIFILFLLASAATAGAQLTQYTLRAKHFSELSVSGAVHIDCRVVPDSAGIVVYSASSRVNELLKMANPSGQLIINLARTPGIDLRKELSTIVVYLSGTLDRVLASGSSRISIPSVGSPSSDIAVIMNGSGSISIGSLSASVANISLSGSGTINLADTHDATIINLSCAGSGRINAPKLKSATVNSTLRGSGRISVGGSANQASAVVSGSGSVSLADLSTKSLKASATGSGEIIYNCSVSKITKQGNPTLIRSNK